MLLQIALDLAVDSADDARHAIRLIEHAFNLSAVTPPGVIVTPPGETFVPADPTFAPGSGTTDEILARVELDADGLPYDARIHSGGAKKNADGRWKAKRGVSDDERKRVEAELRSIIATAHANLAADAEAEPDPAVVFASAAEAIAHAPVPPPLVAVPAAPAVPPPPVVAAPAVPPTPATATMTTFGELAAWVTPKLRDNVFTREELAEACFGLGAIDPTTGIGSFAVVAKDASLVPGLYDALVRLVAEKGA